MKSPDKSTAVVPVGPSNERNDRPRKGWTGSVLFIFSCVVALLVGGGLLVASTLGARVGAEPTGAGNGASEKSGEQDTGRRVTFNSEEIRILSSLENLRDQLANQKIELDRRESRVALTERELNGRIEQLQKLRDEIALIYRQEEQEKDARVQAMADSLSKNMKPNKAAAILSEIDLPTAVRILPAIPKQKLSGILEKMDKNRAARLTAAYLNEKPRGAAKVDPGRTAEP